MHASLPNLDPSSGRWVPLLLASWSENTQDAAEGEDFILSVRLGVHEKEARVDRWTNNQHKEKSSVVKGTRGSRGLGLLPTLVHMGCGTVLTSLDLGEFHLRNGDDANTRQTAVRGRGGAHARRVQAGARPRCPLLLQASPSEGGAAEPARRPQKWCRLLSPFKSIVGHA